MNATSDSREGSADPSRRRQALRELVRNTRLSILSFVLIGATLFTWQYPFHRDPNQDSKHPFWEWLIYPKERNAFLRTEETNGLPQLFSLFYEPQSKILWAGGSHGLVLATADGGKIWATHQIPLPVYWTNQPPPIRKIHFFDATNGWVQTLDYVFTERARINDVYWTTNGGQGWQPANAEIKTTSGVSRARDYLFWRNGEGVAVFPDRIERTTNWGRNWAVTYGNSSDVTPENSSQKAKSAARDIEENGAVIALTSTGSNRVWGSTSEGRTIIGDGRGATWRVNSATNAALVTIECYSNEFLYGMGIDGEIQVSTAGKVEQWETRSRVELPAFYDLFKIVQMDEWPDVPQASLRFADPLNGWLLFAPGRLWHSQTNYLVRTTDGGFNWNFIIGIPGAYISMGEISTNQPTNHLSLLNAMAVQDANTLWLTGPDLQVSHTVDGGRTWDCPMLPYRSHPPGWYWLVCVLAFVGLVLELTRETKTERRPLRILQPDSPIENEKQDCFDFLPIARALARFFQNPETIPPFTVAITGPWGKGKSSLMNLVKGQLNRNGVRTVWFNAWHNQNEESVFASLLKNITEQAVPSRLNPVYWPFFLKLVWIRTRRRWLISFGLVLLLGIGFGLSRVGNLDQQKKVITSFTELLKAKAGLEADQSKTNPPAGQPTLTNQTKIATEIAPKNTSSNQRAGDTSRWPIFLAVVPTLIALWRALRGISAKPEEMLLEAVKGASISDLGAKVSFQMRFKEEFNDVTEAFGDKQLVIFIDDLDRCAPEKILQMMEAINFLVSAGKCFVVLGLSQRQIEAGLSLAFATIASEIELDETELRLAAEVEDPIKKKRLAYARFYLKKLINLRIRLPKTKADDIAKKIARKSEPIPEEGWMPWKRGLKIIAVTGGFFLMFYFGLFAGQDGGKRLADREESKPPVPAVAAQPEALRSYTNQGPSTRSTGGTLAGSNNVPTISAPNVPTDVKQLPAPPKYGAQVAWWCGAGVVLIFVSGLYFALRRLVSIQFEDSDAFLEALRSWKNEITFAYPTGRESIRFVNLVRYMALRARGEEPILTEWQIFKKGLRKLSIKSEPEADRQTASAPDSLSEADVVAFSAYEAAMADCPDVPENVKKEIELSCNDKIQEIKKSSNFPELEKRYHHVAEEVSIN